MQLRFGGIASGLDTESIIRDLMTVQRLPLDRLFQKKVATEWKRDEYRSINTKLLRLRDASFNMRLTGNYIAQKAVSSKPDAITASATGRSQAGSYDIKVTSLADVAKMTSTQGTEIAKNFQIFKGENSSFQLQGLDGTMETIEIASGDDLQAVLDKINGHKNLGISVFYDAASDRASVITKGTGRTSTISSTFEANFLGDVLGIGSTQTGVSVAGDDQQKTLTIDQQAMKEGLRITIGGKTFGVWDSDSSNPTYATKEEAAKALGTTTDLLFDLSDLSDSDDAATKFADHVAAKLGESEGLEFSLSVETPGTLSVKIKPEAPEGTTLPDIHASQVIANGTNAQLTINGLDVQRQGNTFDLNGTNITLHDVTGEGVRIDISHDGDSTFDKIKGFVDLYNEIINDIHLKLDEQKFRDFSPLTDEQKKDMSDKEIEIWEEKAKSGMLRGDSMLSGILSDLRLALNSRVTVDGKTISLYDLGITTGAWQEKGKLHINETKLREAIRDNPEGVLQLFTANTKDGDKEVLGIARLAQNSLDAGMSRLTSTAGKASTTYDQSFLSEEIRRYEDRMGQMEDRLVLAEQRYWRQFTAMEKALAKLNSQSDWLYQQLTSMNG